MITFEWMGNESTKGYALGVAYNSKVKSLWVMCVLFMIIFAKEKNHETT